MIRNQSYIEELYHKLLSKKSHKDYEITKIAMDQMIEATWKDLEVIGNKTPSCTQCEEYNLKELKQLLEKLRKCQD